MKTIDFSSLKKDFSLLNDNDILFLNDFFNESLILNMINSIEKKRKSSLIIIIIVFIIAVLWILVVFNIPELNHTTKDWVSIASYIFWWIIVCFWLFFKYLKSKFTSSIKWDILSKMVEKTKLDVEYSAKWEFFSDDLNVIANETKIIRHFDRLNFKEDGIKIENNEKWFLITWTEFQTSKRTKDNKWRTRYTVNNHSYILKIKFINPKFLIKSPITLFYEKSNLVLNIVAWIIFLLLLFGTIEVWKDLWVILWIYSILLLWFYFYNWNKNKKRIKLENIDFEKEFDVFWEDNIEARQVLNPAFMYRIYDYVNKVNKNRKYNLYFKEDYIYIKHDIDWDFLEISFFKSLLKNLRDYVEFYIEIKNIWELATDLKLWFYDKWFSSKNIIE